MKKSLILLPLLALSLTSCGKYLDKPEDTNLEYWITERVTLEQAIEKGCTPIGGMFGGDMFLGSAYEMVEDEDHHKQLPEAHVKYILTGYPDTTNKYAVTSIEITDPEVYVYGLTMASSKEEIDIRMKELKFNAITDEYGRGRYNKNNCTFIFDEKHINISASVSNIWHVIY